MTTIKYDSYFDNGKLAITSYKNDKDEFHNTDGPALIYYNYDSGYLETIFYMLNDEEHRIDGPAIISYDKNGNIVSEEYRVNGIYCKDINVFKKMIKILNIE